MNEAILRGVGKAAKRRNPEIKCNVKIRKHSTTINGRYAENEMMLVLTVWSMDSDETITCIVNGHLEITTSLREWHIPLDDPDSIGKAVTLINKALTE